jgi:hypothetical protein
VVAPWLGGRSDQDRSGVGRVESDRTARLMQRSEGDMTDLMAAEGELWGELENGRETGDGAEFGGEVVRVERLAVGWRWVQQ